MNLLSFVPRTDVRGYILVPLRGPRMMVLFHRRRLRSHTDSTVLGFTIPPPWGMGTQVDQPFAASLNIL